MSAVSDLLFMSMCLLYSMFFIFAPSVTPLSFSFDFSDSSGYRYADLSLERNASLRPPAIQLSGNDMNDKANNTYGRVSYAHPVRLWDAATGELASFTTTFSFRITVEKGSLYSPGDGMAFFLGHYPSRIPNNSYGGNLGLIDGGHHFNATGNLSIVAVEFDTFYNPEWDNTSDDHIGINVNSVMSVAYTSVISRLTTGEVMTAWISYDSATKILKASLRNSDSTLYHVNWSFDLAKYLPEEVAVGFSASTGFSVEVHEVLNWAFSSTLEGRKKGSHTLLAVLIPVLFAMVVFPILGFWLWRQRGRKMRPSEATGDSEDEEEQGEAKFEKGVGPRRYRFRELADATSNFADEEKLGRGGFGNVYLGRVDDQECPVAIKMFSPESSSQGRKEFEAEVNIISRLRHRNLVQLLGWCDNHKGLLLVYELVAGGSLDRQIHSNERWLTWAERYNIILGLGSALHYLHEEWEQCVVHGDIKPSNIMIDSSCNAKLGDFGLARLIDHGSGQRTTHVVIGTAGYIDPEFVNTRKQSKESDIYSFGIVLLEIVSDRHPVEEQPDGDQFFVLLKWVWNLQGNSRILEAADKKIRGDDLEERQMERVLVVGLWCAHPDRSERPSISQAMHVLSSDDAPLPALPPQMYNNAANVAISQSAYSVFSIDNSSSVQITTARSSSSSATALVGDYQVLA